MRNSTRKAPHYSLQICWDDAPLPQDLGMQEPETLSKEHSPR